MEYVHVIIIVVSVGLAFAKKIKIKSACLAGGLAVVGLLHSVGMQPEIAVLEREDQGGEESVAKLYVAEQDESPQMMEIVVPALQYEKQELNQLAEEAFIVLEREMLGDNEAISQVTQPLNLPEAIDGYPFEVVWKRENRMLIGSSGEVWNQELSEGVICQVTAILQYEDETWERDYELTICPEVLTGDEQRLVNIRHYIETLLAEHEKEQVIPLPEKIAGSYVYGSIPNQAMSFIWPGMGIVALLYTNARKKDQEKQRLKKREMELQSAYPMFVNLLALYMSAGMPVKVAMKQCLMACQSPVLKQELQITFNEIETGISEREAYANFARRCGEVKYRKLVSLLIQNITIGSKGLIEKLDELEMDAFLLQKEVVKQKGEAASTKLLFPMIILLLVVMLLLIVPGFMGMQF